MLSLSAWACTAVIYVVEQCSFIPDICCRAKLRKDAKVREVYKFGKTLGTGGEPILF